MVWLEITFLYDLVLGTWHLLERMAIYISGSGYQIQKHSGISVYKFMQSCIYSQPVRGKGAEYIHYACTPVDTLVSIFFTQFNTCEVYGEEQNGRSDTLLSV